MKTSSFDRRAFLQLSGGLAGLAAFAPQALHAAADSSTGPYRGPYWLLIHAGGGWDPIFLTDPKASTTYNRITQAIGQVGRIPFAPIELDSARLTSLGFNGADPIYQQTLVSNELFFTRHKDRLTVLNGIDTKTNNHDTGTANTWSGQGDGYPALGAMIANVKGPSKPLAFVSAGGYDIALDQVALSRISNTNSIYRIAKPNTIDVNNPNSDTYHGLSAYDHLEAARVLRMDRLQRNLLAQRAQEGIGAMLLAKQGAGELANIVFPDDTPQLPPGLGDLQGMYDDIHTMLYAFNAGIAVAATVSLGGFDTHGGHDVNQVRAMTKLITGVDFAFRQLDAMGLADKTYVLVSSEFGRGPYYNSGAGKDHWPVTTMLMAGPTIEGNRLIGGTTEDVKPLAIHPTSLQIDSSGVPLTYQDIHRELRRISGVQGQAGDVSYPLPQSAIRLFG